MFNLLQYLYYKVYLWFNPNKKLAKAKQLSTNLRSRKRWTQEEISDMLFMYKHGGSISFIANELDRPEAGVRSKLISLGYSTRK